MKQIKQTRNKDLGPERGGHVERYFYSESDSELKTCIGTRIKMAAKLVAGASLRNVTYHLIGLAVHHRCTNRPTDRPL